MLTAVAVSPQLFRRAKEKPTRDDAFQELFDLLARLYEQAARLKPGWTAAWNVRERSNLPPKYDFGDRMAADAARDMRFATALLQQNRWRSKTLPLFETFDVAAWSAFQGGAANISIALLDIADARTELLQPDERDWIESSVEQFDDATRRRRDAERSGIPQSTLVAEGTYQALYTAILLSDRLIERRRFQAEQRR